MSDSNLTPPPLPPQPPQYDAYQRPRYNTVSIVAFVLAFFVSIVGIILGFVALSQIKRTGEQGRGLALAAVIIGFAEVAIGILLFVLIVALGLGIASSNYTVY